MLEERLFLILSYLLIASLLLLFCFFTPFSRKAKLTGIFVVAAFYFASWNSYINILGWPSTEDLPEIIPPLGAIWARRTPLGLILSTAFDSALYAIIDLISGR